MKKVMALDLAVSTGMAMSQDLERPPLLQTWRLLPATVEGQHGRAYVELERRMMDMIAVERPDVLWFEAPAETGNRPTWLAQLLFGVAAVAELVATRQGILPLQGNASTVRKWVLGRGRKTKDDQRSDKLVAKAYCEARGWRYDSDDAADAAVLLVYGCACPPVGVKL